MNKSAQNQYPINALSKGRWSPRAFSNQPVEPGQLKSILEAARWSASAGNEQPWYFMVGIHPDETWMKLFDTLMEGNKTWVGSVPVLLLSIRKKTRGEKNEENGYSSYDTGQSVAHLSIEAMNHGLYVHQMAGFFPEKAVLHFQIPQDYQPLTVIAIGYPGDPESLTGDLKKYELAIRSRKSFDEFVFSGAFGKKSGLF